MTLDTGSRSPKMSTQGRLVIEYPIPSELPQGIKWARRVVIVAGLSGFVSFSHVISSIDSVVGTLSGVESVARAAVEAAAAPRPQDLTNADVLTIAKEFSDTFIALLSAVFLYFPVRYYLLFRRIPKGHPNTYTALRHLTICQIAVETIRVLTFVTINEKTAVIKLPVTAASPGLVLSAALLFLITRRKAKAFFFRPKMVPVRMEETRASS